MGSTSDYAASSLIPSLRDLKCLNFGTADVEIKSNWLRMPGERQKHYLVPFDITEEALAQFTNDYYQLLDQAHLVLLGSVVNKLHMQEDYLKPWYPLRLRTSSCFSGPFERSLQARRLL